MRFVLRVAVLGGLLLVGARFNLAPEASAARTESVAGEREEEDGELWDEEDEKNLPLPVFKTPPIKLVPGYLFDPETGMLLPVTKERARVGKGVRI